MRFLGQEVGNISAVQDAALPLCYLFFSLVELIDELNWVRLLPAHTGSKANANCGNTSQVKVLCSKAYNDLLPCPEVHMWVRLKSDGGYCLLCSF